MNVRLLFLITFFINPKIWGQHNFILDSKVNLKKGRAELYSYINKDTSVNKLATSKISNDKFIIKVNQTFQTNYFLKIFLNDSCIYISDYFTLDSGYQKGLIDISKNETKILNRTMSEFYDSRFYKVSQRLKKDALSFIKIKEEIEISNKINYSDSLSNVIDLIQANLLERKNIFVIDLNYELNDSYFAFWLLFDEYSKTGYKPIYDSIFSRFSDKIKQSYFGNIFEMELYTNNIASIGQIFPVNIFKNLKNNIDEVISIKSKFTLVDFWHTHCGICISQFPELIKINKEFSVKGFEIISISVDKLNDYKNIEYYRKKFNFQWTELYDENGVFANKINLFYYPSNFLLNSSGEIIKKDIKPNELLKFLTEANL